jgi:methylenetetrahydrofolate reductase (NADPH)
MLIGSYPGFKKMTKLCKTRVPEDLQISMESLKDDDEGVKEFGIKYGFKIVTQLLELDITGLHFYTLNSSYQTSRIIDELASLGLLRISSSPLNSFS